MNLITFDNIVKDPEQYVKEIETYGFQEIASGEKTFSNIQPRGNDDEFAKFMLTLFPGYKIKWNVIRKSDPSDSSNRLNLDGMTGDITAILSLTDTEKDRVEGIVLFDEDHNVLCTTYLKFNRMIAFDATAIKDKNAYELIAKKETVKLSQIIFLEENE
jgi:hypothetical protein